MNKSVKMKCWLGVFALVGCLFLATADTEVKFGDQTYLEQEKDLLLVLKYVHQPSWNPDLHAFGFFYEISDDYESYNDVAAVKEFVRLFELKRFLKRKAGFSAYNPEHLEQAGALFRVFMSAKNYETLAKVVAWARFNVNEKIFMYVIGLTVTHREDLKSLIMPPPYEVCPYQFVHSEAIKFAQRQAMQGFSAYEKVNGHREMIVPVNYTGWFMHMNEDQKVSYFTEDVTWNALYYNFNLAYPHWLEGKPYGLDNDRRGELFIWFHHQMIVRYNLERLSNGLGHIPEFNWRQPVKSGYKPLLFTVSGKQMESRPNHYNFYHEGNFKFVQQAEDRERRIRDVVDAGFITFKNQNISVSKPEDVNILGNLLQGNPDTFDLHHNFHDHIVPSFLENFSTAARDPLFYQFNKHLMHNFWRFTSHLAPYTVEEIGFKGVTIKSVKVSKLVTFFENFDIDITNSLDHPVPTTVKKLEEVTEVNFKPDEFFVKARTVRLNHKSFTVKINVQSESAQDASVRVFIGPKYDEFGSLIKFEENHVNFYLFDIFKHSLTVGENIITRESSQFAMSTGDYTSFYDLYVRVMSAKKSEKEWTHDLFAGRCGSPDHLLLPKGQIGGLTYQFYFIITPLQASATPMFSTFDSKTSCGIGSGSRYFESRSLLFPLDRPVDPIHFYTPNMHFEDIDIFFNAGENAARYI